MYFVLVTQYDIWYIWRPTWKMAAILDFWLANVFFFETNPMRICMQILVLVSQFERFYCYLLHYLDKLGQA